MERWIVWTLDTIAWIVWTLDMDMTRNWIVGTLHRWLEKAPRWLEKAAISFDKYCYIDSHGGHALLRLLQFLELRFE